MAEDAAELMRLADRARREALSLGPRSQRAQDRMADAHRNLVEAVALCRQAGVGHELIQALKRLGQIERDLGHSDAARAFYEEAVAICREDGDPLTLAHTVRHLGDIHQDAGRAKLAETCYHEALAIYRGHEQTHPLDLANAIRPLAILEESRGQSEEACRLWEEARDLYAAVNVQEGVAESSARLARLMK